MSTVLSDAETAFLKSKIPAMAEEICTLDGKPIELERDWQYNLVGSTATNEVYNKARQMGYSWGTALRTNLRAQLFPKASYNAVLVSINREEAREKIRYIEQILDGMRYKKNTIIMNRLEIEFDNGNRIQSFPSRTVRGIPNVDLYLDEFAHIADAGEIYSGSTASTVRQSYGTTVGSTPFGRGAFFDIVNGAGRPGEYEHFILHEIPWWHSRILCRDVESATVFAPGMRTSERVMEYGTENLIREFKNHSLEAFKIEFECFLSDYGNSVLSKDMIMSCYDGNLPCGVLDINCDDKAVQTMELIKIKLKEVLFEEGITEGYIGYDVGREVHASELTLLSAKGGKLQTRFYLTLRKAPYPLQREVLTYFINNVRIQKCVVDAQGIGNQMAQELQTAFSTKVITQNFTELTKADMVGMLLKAFEDKLLVIYPTRRNATQLMDVKKIFSVTGRVLYRSAATKEAGPSGKEFKSHADLFWSLAMAVLGAQDYLLDRGIKTTTRGPALALPSNSANRIVVPRSSGLRMISPGGGSGYGHHSRGWN